MKLTVISLGGSIVAPEKVDTDFLKALKGALSNYLEENRDDKLILVIGGGAPARIYQGAYREVATQASNDYQDWIGIKATHLNGTLIRYIFSDYVENDLITDPTLSIEFKGRILVAAGWKPGFSTDTDAVYLAQKFGGKRIINLSNIAKVYTDDPRTNPNAKPIDSISWKAFREMVGDEWIPGKNTPFDPIASKIAEKEGMTVICADGRNIENLIAILNGSPLAVGTVIS